MRAARRFVLSLALGITAISVTPVALPSVADGVAAKGLQSGQAVVRDVGSAGSDASTSVTVRDIITGDAIAPAISVDARGATAPVVVSVAGSFPDSSVDIVAPGGSSQAGTTGGNANSASNILCDVSGPNYSSRTSQCNAGSHIDQSIEDNDVVR
ncbi:MAG: hypothetical protein IT338_05590 [Thermomicrobiales bacterium]|nr:hypothetical protein [Thermomicrobiales bacterium]